MSDYERGKRAGIVAGLLLLLVLLAGCGAWASWYVEDGVLVDQLFSVETRRNGTVLVWAKNDETGVYCVENGNPSRADLDEMVRSRQEVEIRYHETRFLRGTPCWGAEDGVGYEVFVVDYISPIRR